MSTESETGKHKRGILFIILLLMVECIPPGGLMTAQDNNPGKTTWLDDLDFIAGNINRYHPDPHYRIDKPGFERICLEQRTAIDNSSTDEECLVALMKVVAALRDGHTHIDPKNRFNTDRYLPFRFFVFEDGIYVISTIGRYESLIGSKLTSINDLAVEEVIDRLNSIITSDNDIGRMNSLPMYIINMGYLKGLGIIDSPDSARLGFIREDGTGTVVTVHSVTEKGGSEWFKRSLNKPGDTPYVVPFRDEVPYFMSVMVYHYENYRFDLFKESRTLIMQLNQMIDQPGRPFKSFRDEFWAFFEKESEAFDRFVLDLRHNTGGNGQLAIDFAREIISHEDDLGGKDFVVITGRQTYSAAIILASQLRAYTQAIFVGEPMGGPLHLWSTALQLGQVPGASFEFHVSSMEFNLGLPAGKEYLFPPQIPVVATAREFLSGRDVVLDYILSHDLKEEVFNLKDEIFRSGTDPNTSVLQAWEKGLIDEENLREVTEKARNLDHDWGVHTDECGFYPFGSRIRESYLKYELLIVANGYAGRGQPEYAEAFYELLTMLIPGYLNGWFSYAGFLETRDETGRAEECYMKILELDPGNPAAQEKIKILRDKKDL